MTSSDYYIRRSLHPLRLCAFFHICSRSSAVQKKTGSSFLVDDNSSHSDCLCGGFCFE